MSMLLCFSGAIGSGKSSVSTAVAETLGWPRTAFGDYLRNELSRLGGDASSREALQELGQQRVTADATSFCRDVLLGGGFSCDVNFVIDGVRHVHVYNILEKLAAPGTARLIFLQAGDKTRSTRTQARPDGQDFERASHHTVEAESRQELPVRADVCINAEREFELVTADCLRSVRQWQAAAVSI